MKEAKHFPKPEYDRCNKGHQLVEIYNEKRNRWDWDCPICKAKMDKLGSFSHPKGTDEEYDLPYKKKFDSKDITKGVMD